MDEITQRDTTRSNSTGSAEDEDLSSAIAASLELPQSSPSRATNHIAWNPNSPTEWWTYNRQMAAYRDAVELSRDLHLQAAIEDSIQEASSSQSPLRTEDGEPGPSGEGRMIIPSSETRLNSKEICQYPTIEARIEDLSRNLETEVSPRSDMQGDTYVYIDPPPRQPEQDQIRYERYIERYKNPIVMQSKMLISLNSPFFNKLFGSTHQYRVIRRRGLVDKLPDSIKFVIDLTPPTEGDEAVYLTTELCCSEGVMKWYQAGQRWGIGKAMIGGGDDHMLGADAQYYQSHQTRRISSMIAKNVQSRFSSIENQIRSEHSPLTAFAVPKYTSAPIPEYSPVRHRCAIERVLAVIQGLDPQLNSAPKVWTTFAVAKYFNVAHSHLMDYIVRWLRGFPNSFFIEVLPETTLKIADGLQCPELCRDTFAILVGEEALENSRSILKVMGNAVTLFGRRRTELPEAYLTSLEYASKAFLDRTISSFMSLVNDEMRWIENLPEFGKLSYTESSSVDIQNTSSALKRLLKDYIKGAVYTILCKDYNHMPGPAEGFSGGEDLFPRASWVNIWTSLVPRQRILTRSFWRALSECTLFEGSSNYSIGEPDTFSVMSELTPIERELQEKNVIQQIWNEDIERMVTYLKEASEKYVNTVASGFVNRNTNIRDASNLPQSNQISLVEGNNTCFVTDHTHKIIQVRDAQDSGQQDKRISPKVDVIFDNTLNGEMPKPEPAISESSSDRPALGKFPPGMAPDDTPADNLLPEFTLVDNDFDEDLYLDNQPLLAQAETEAGYNSFERHAPEKITQPSFDLSVFFGQASNYLAVFAERMLSSPDASIRHDTLELKLTNTLVCLTDSEWKYLPLWAGGNDDGSGGVYNDELPLSHDEFSTAGPKVHTGSVSSTDSGYTILQSAPSNSELNTSAVAVDGYSDTLPRGYVVPDEYDVPWHIPFYESKGQAKERLENTAASSKKSASSVTFDILDEPNVLKTSTEQKMEEEQCTKKMVDTLAALEEEVVASEEADGEDPDDVIHDLLGDGDSDDAAELASGSEGDGEDEDDDMIIV